ncbi:MAG: hypothetical protein CO108_21855 [Deltaproteobacteria bacterium CG_4_9_14_3_um_filter_63_12]|nr:MAG: hypothetical protein CO108_21855 [Deltaproteobacteria bacterium CG_4_9_14_3_um_filter_63_12]
MGDWELEIEGILRAPDATPEHCLGTTVTMTKGDLITVQLVEFGPRDLIEVFAVEPNGSCASATETSQLKLSITQFDPSERVFIGQGTTATLPEEAPPFH